MKTRIQKVARFIKEHGITPSPSERFIGMRDTVFAWAITALAFTFYETPEDLSIASISFFIKFITGCLAIFLYVLFESFCRGNKLNGLSALLIKNYNETATQEVHLNTKQRIKYIYTRGAVSAGSYIGLNISKDIFGVIDNSAIFGADALVYAIFASFVFLQKFTLKEWIGIVIGFLGVAFILFIDISSFSWKTGVSSGIAGILSAMLFTIMFFMTSIIIRHDTPVRLAFHQCVVGGLLSILLFLSVSVINIFSKGEINIPDIPIQAYKDAIAVGLLYAASLILFFRAWLFTEPIIIAMLGYSLGIFAFFFEWLFKKVSINYLNLIGEAAITIGCSFVIYQEYLRGILESRKEIHLKPVYQRSLKSELQDLERKFHLGVLDKYEYITEKHEYNKLLIEYTGLIKNSLIKSIEIEPEALIFNLKELNIQMEVDGGARSAPFEILNFGSYEPDDEYMVYSLVKNGDVFFDIGAHIGWYSINIAKRFEAVKVYSFEPVKFTFDMLKRNVERNKLINVNLFNIGVSSKDEEKDLFYFKGGSAIASVQNLINHKNVSKIKCFFKTLDTIVNENSIDRIDFIKCDVEGSELDVIQGGELAINKFKPIILLELYEEWCKKCGYSTADVINNLNAIGYKGFQVNDKKLCQVENITLIDNEHYNYFFLHEIKHSNIIKAYS